MKSISLSRSHRRKTRVSSDMIGTAERPRISVYRSSKHIYAQAIDDMSGTTLASYSSSQVVVSGADKNSKTKKASQVGKELAKLLQEKKISKGIFDRGASSYLGRVKALCDGLREAGITI